MATSDVRFTGLGRIWTALTARRPRSAVASFSRPANTTQYAVGDVIYPPVPGEDPQIASLEFEGLTAESLETLIINAKLIDFSAEATRLDAVLWLFKAPLATLPVDNEAFSPSNADMRNFVCTIAFSDGIVQTAGAHSIYEPEPSKVASFASGSNSLHGYLVAANAMTPISAGEYQIELGTIPKDLGIF
jgi:hypothetical protein